MITEVLLLKCFAVKDSLSETGVFFPKHKYHILRTFYFTSSHVPYIVSYMNKNTTPRFRADYAAECLYAQAIVRFPYSLKDPADSLAATKEIDRLISLFGPVVTSYPIWHPLYALVRFNTSGSSPTLRDDEMLLLRDALVATTSRALDFSSMNGAFTNFPANAAIQSPGLIPVLVVPEIPKGKDGSADKWFVLQQLLLKVGDYSSVMALPWGDARSSLLGSPCGMRSSLFVN